MTNSIIFKGVIEMDDIFDIFDWEDMGMIGGMVEEFTEDEMELLEIEQDLPLLKNDIPNNLEP